MHPHPNKAINPRILRNRFLVSHVSNRKSIIPNKHDMQIKAAMLTMIFFFMVVLISKLTEFRTDNQFLLAVAFFDATYDLCIDAEALRDSDYFFCMFR